jgi:2'-5' RNA ligase
VGRYFTSFDDAWRAFLARTEPLESFYDEFTGGAFDGEVWVIEPPPDVKRAALRVQGELEPFDFLELVPHHFLHVSVPPAAVRAFDEPIDLEYSRVNCFHTAVVAEVDAPALRALDPTPTFLPHMTLAVVRRPEAPDELRRVLEPLRETSFGRQRVDEILRIHVELSPERGLQPWAVVDRVRA